MFDVTIAPSILSADFARLADEVDSVGTEIGAIHVDVMDGHYVPNISIGPPVVASLRSATSHRLDCHLMVTDPGRYGPRLAELGAESVTFHPEVEDDPRALVDELHGHGIDVGVAIKPAHPVAMVAELLPHVDLLLVMTVEPGFGGQPMITDALQKVAEARRVRRDHGYRFRIQVDGGIGPGTIGAAAVAGAEDFVAGSAVFDRDDRAAAVTELAELARNARQHAE